MTQQNDSQLCIGSALMLAAIVFITGCAPGPPLDLYDGPQRSDKNVATIVPERGCWHCVQWIRTAATQTQIYTYPIRENSFDTLEVPGKFRVPPGEYELLIVRQAGKTDGAGWRGYVELKAGQTYHVKSDRCTMLCWGRHNTLHQTWVWIEETGTNDVLIGYRTPKNDTEGAEWYRFAAQQNNVEYQFRFARIYEKGQGVPQNDVLAYMWYSLAASDYFSDGRAHMESKLTPSQLTEARRLAKQWRPNTLVDDLASEQVNNFQRLARQWVLIHGYDGSMKWWKRK